MADPVVGEPVQAGEGADAPEKQSRPHFMIVACCGLCLTWKTPAFRIALIVQVIWIILLSIFLRAIALMVLGMWTGAELIEWGSDSEYPKENISAPPNWYFGKSAQCSGFHYQFGGFDKCMEKLDADIYHGSINLIPTFKTPNKMWNPGHWTNWYAVVFTHLVPCDIFFYFHTINLSNDPPSVIRRTNSLAYANFDNVELMKLKSQWFYGIFSFVYTSFDLCAIMIGCINLYTIFFWAPEKTEEEAEELEDVTKAEG